MNSAILLACFTGYKIAKLEAVVPKPLQVVLDILINEGGYLVRTGDITVVGQRYRQHLVGHLGFRKRTTDEIRQPTVAALFALTAWDDTFALKSLIPGLDGPQGNTRCCTREHFGT